MVTSNENPLRVLVVDDDEDAAYVLEKLLGAMGCSAKGCSVPAKSIAAAKSLSPHLIILDLMMPGMDGLALAKALSEVDLPPYLLVALSGVSDTQTQEDCGACGFHSFVSKPATIEVLRELLDDAHEFMRRSQI